MVNIVTFQNKAFSLYANQAMRDELIAMPINQHITQANNLGQRLNDQVVAFADEGLHTSADHPHSRQPPHPAPQFPNSLNR
jgi:hypothetical protein